MTSHQLYNDLVGDLRKLSRLLHEKRSDIAEILEDLSNGVRLEKVPSIESRFVEAQIPAMLSVDGKPIDLLYDTLTTLIEFKTAEGEWEEAVNHDYSDNDEEVRA